MRLMRGLQWMGSGALAVTTVLGMKLFVSGLQSQETVKENVSC